jgi:hypothetical protein
VTTEITTQGLTVLGSFASQYVRVDRAVVAVYVVTIGILVDGVSDQST